MAKSKKKERRNKLKSLVLLLFLTIVLLTTSTYAWFTANRTVSIDPIEVNIAATSGLQISTNATEWKTLITNDDIVNVTGYTGNVNMVPGELAPVSTTGETASGFMKFFKGVVAGDENNGGAMSLTAGACPAEAAGTTGDYIAFDIYLKNSSSKATDNLQLAKGSFIKITKDQAQAADNGQDNTGLEFSVRSAIELYSNTATFTDSKATINALTFGSPVVTIWEPNYDRHIAEIVANDGRITDAVQEFDTLAMNSSSVGKNIKGINGVGTAGAGAGLSVELDSEGNVKEDPPGVAGTYMTIPNTLQTGGTISDNDLQLYSVNGTQDEHKITLPGNAISKARVYIWLEGQDPDCQDTASTGKSFDLQINLSKPAVT